VQFSASFEHRRNFRCPGGSSSLGGRVVSVRDSLRLATCFPGAAGTGEVRAREI
jgi:hypothetical protein